MVSGSPWVAREDLDSGGSNYFAVIRCEQTKQSDNSPEQAHSLYSVWAGLIIIFGIEVCSIPLWYRYRTLSSGSIEVSIPTTRYRPPLLHSPYSPFTLSILSLYTVHTLPLAYPYSPSTQSILSLYKVHTLLLLNPYSRFTQSILCLYPIHTLTL